MSLVVLFLSAIALSVLLRYMDSDFPFAIFKLFFLPFQYDDVGKQFLLH
jgi:hypothetical protein